MNALRQSDKNIVFLTSIILVGVMWHFFGITIAQVLWPSISIEHPFDVTTFLQAAIFLFALPVMVALILSWFFGLWKGISVGRALLLATVCLIFPSLIDSGLSLFSKSRPVFVTIGSGK